MKTSTPLLLLLAFAQASFAQLSGPLSGTLGPGVFHVIDTISVELGDSLTLVPGTAFTFDGPYPFYISGTLLAEGTETDSIVFTTDTAINPDGWRGMRFSDSTSSGSQLAYCIVEKSSHSSGVNCMGNSSPSFKRCAISGNSADFSGGGIACDQGSPTFEYCTISGNISGGMDWTDGGGVFCWDASPVFEHCTISGNTVYGDGGGVAFVNQSSPAFTNCTIVGNYAAAVGGGVACLGGSPTFSSTIIAFCDGEGIYFSPGSEVLIAYCGIFGNSRGDLVGNIPTGVGEIVRTNENGDSCDTCFNIFLDPMFADTATGDYHLLAGSPCIDAGDPTLPFDPDTTIADIGAFYFDQLATEPPAILLPTTFALYPNWPNPFNSTTMIRYDVPQAGKVSLTIFNLLGQRVTTLFDGQQVAGSYTISWDAADLPSGVYLCRMQTQGFMQTRKMLLVK
jgi:parallel beta-helix repeat protein